MSMEKITKITAAEIERYSPEALANRPNNKTGFGRSGMSAEELKAFLSALAKLGINKVNEILDAFGSEGEEGALLHMLYTAFDDDTNDEQRMTLARWMKCVNSTIKAYETPVSSASAGEEAAVEVVFDRANDTLSFHFTLPRGERGEVGPQGIQGPQGEKGDKGDKGDTGPQGPRGVQGQQGPKGDGLEIDKTYASVDAMNEGFATDGLPEGAMVLIATDVNIEENARLYTKGADGYVYLCDLSGARGIQGERGAQGPQGEKGEKGDKGDTGATGADGKDYVLTDADREGIVQAVLDALGESDDDADGRVFAPWSDFDGNSGYVNGVSGDSVVGKQVYMIEGRTYYLEADGEIIGSGTVVSQTEANSGANDGYMWSVGNAYLEPVDGGTLGGVSNYGTISIYCIDSNAGGAPGVTVTFCSGAYEDPGYGEGTFVGGDAVLTVFCEEGSVPDNREVTATLYCEGNKIGTTTLTIDEDTRDASFDFEGFCGVNIVASGYTYYVKVEYTIDGVEYSETTRSVQYP